MASSPSPDHEQALYKVRNWLRGLDGDDLSSSGSSLSATSASNAPTSTSDLDTSGSESSEYTNVPTEYYGYYRLGGRAVPENVAGAWEPVDDMARRSSLLLHMLWYAMNDEKFYSSPTSHLRKVMDIGSGTCTWSMHFATQNPGSHVVAIDKSPFMPRNALPNLEMICEDLNLAHPFEESSADLLFFRQLVWSEDLGGLFRNALRFLKPGGWIEFTLLKPKPRHQHTTWLAWERLVRKIGRRTNRVFPTLDLVKCLIQDAGLSQVETKEVCGAASQYGFTTTDLRDFDIRGQIMLPLYEGLGFTLPEIELLAMEMRQELAEDMEFESFVVYAQKPPQTGTAML
ncbi:hypothetical protein CEP51_015379 [Fusarium floridanum]|uniref:Methyltransferase domain-containing protein n=1 Tax=Fusarium floridanum TaxID=1325733 RepID=A0A428PB45_9HYPO|nr:hypothetical protein CEP51_015379 [Fusarium floridanum]